MVGTDDTSRASAFAPASAAITAPSLSLPKSGGSVRGMGEKLNANAATGTAALSVPIATSPGRSGFGPSLALAYDSGHGNGVFGFGWTLDLAAITLRTDKGLPKYDGTDVFVMSDVEDLVPLLVADGDRWVPAIEETAEYRIERFRPRIEGGFARIERWTRLADGDTHWRSVSQDNVASWYGRDRASRIADPEDPRRVFSWLLCRREDGRGNAMVYEYLAESGAGADLTRAHEGHRSEPARTANRYPKRIRYGNRVSTLVDPDAADPGWMFEVVFDYGEHDPDTPAPGDQGPLPVRSDPFSSYRAGFEVRTYRLCRRVLMFHHFPAEAGVGADCLVRSTDFGHTPGDSVGTFLTSVSQSGYRRSGDGYVSRSLPPVEFGYTPATLRPQVREVDADSIANLPAGASSAQWTDLDGEGAPGVLIAGSDAWFYKHNLGEGRLGPLQVVGGMPAPSSGTPTKPRLVDLAGEGRSGVATLTGPTPGYVARTPDGGWLPPRSFDSLPTVDFDDPDVRLVDLNGDGLADLLRTEGEWLTWYPSLGAAGYGPGIRLTTAPDERTGPRLVFSGDGGCLYLADMTGDGLSDIVRIRNGSVCYWPNLGHGRFGAQVAMDDAPWFDTEELFDHANLRLTDVDGSGPGDLIYLGADAVQVHLNASGNGWAPPVILAGLPRPGSGEQVDAIDFLGTGTACLVWSSSDAGDAGRPMRYADLLDGVKPHLMERMVNNLGAEILVRYASSTRFYLADLAAGRPWRTRLSFPVQVVERVETVDHISGNRFVSRYAYHHGYFDGIDREFRGFASTEQWDTEELSALDEVDLSVSNVDPTSHVPPVLTRTWFHTGAFVDFGLDLAAEFWAEPGAAGPPRAAAELPDSLLLPDGTRRAYRPATQELREAYRALKGSVLRREVYALDGSAAQDRPYQVGEGTFAVELLQPMAGQAHAVCLSRPLETVTSTYERQLYDIERTDGTAALADPRVTHTVTLDVDGYGRVLRGVEVAYGRRYPDAEADPRLSAADIAAVTAAQTTTHATLTANSYTNGVDEPSAYRTPLPAQSRTYELINVTPGAERFAVAELRTLCDKASDGAHDLPFEDVDAAGAVGDAPYRRLIEHSRSLYGRDDFAGALPLGVAQPLGMPYRNYRLALTTSLVEAVYGDLLPDAGTVLRDECAYLLGDDQRAAGLFPVDDPDGLWWAPSGHLSCSPDAADDPAAELAYARGHFFLSGRYADQFGNVSTVHYDEYDLLIAQTRDALGNVVSAGDRATDDGVLPGGNDYRTLGPRVVSDANRNRTAVAFDVLGMVAATAVMGKTEEGIGDSLDGLQTDLDDAVVAGYFADPLADPNALLGGATTRMLYDLAAFQRDGQPTAAATLTRETHLSDLPAGATSGVLHLLAYKDGLGREVQRKARAEGDRWVGSGWTILNNKGLPVRQYEPFFSATHAYEFAKTVGVSPILCYDPLGRAVATLYADHTWAKSVFDAWRKETWDAADTVLVPDPRTDTDIGGYAERLPEADFLPTWYAQRIGGALGEAERASAAASAIHAGTPGVAYLDSLGRTVVTVTHNRFQHGTEPVEEEFGSAKAVLDIEGNQRAVIDALDRVVMRSDFDLSGGPLHSVSADAGERWMLSDVAGQIRYTWDLRGNRRRVTYDALSRPVDVLASTDGGPEWTANRTVYGEVQADAQAHNLRGRAYRVYDAAGVVTTADYDMKGNSVAGRRQLAVDYRTAPDWSAAVVLAAEEFTSAKTVDALNRPVTLTTPDGSVIRPRYNEAGLPEAFDVSLRGAVPQPFVLGIDYDAKGRRSRIEYANGTVTTYFYDPLTMRPTRVVAMRGSEAVQDLAYAYDAVGNVSHVEDAAQQTVFFRNTRVAPGCDYIYDAAYRLIEAKGREHLGQGGVPVAAEAFDAVHGDLVQPGDGQAMGRYLQRYTYDIADNITQVRHTGSDPAHPGWTRDYAYAEPSAADPSVMNNRLSYTQLGGGPQQAYAYDVHGSMTAMPHLPLMRWNERDQLQSSAQQIVTAGTPETTWYVYDNDGKRIRKVTDRSAVDGETPAMREERIYLGGFEIYRQYAADGQPVLERETLHVIDGRRRLAMVETRTLGDDGTAEQLIRFQLADHLGSASIELDETGRVISYEEYYPHGSTSYQAQDPAIRAARKRYRFTGMERDEESGLSLHGARYYAPWLGRWTSADPAGLADGPNLYAYAQGNPVNGTDTGGTSTQQELDNFAQSFGNQIWGDDQLDADHNGVVDNTNVTIDQLARAVVGHFEGGVSARDTALSIRGVSVEQWKAAESAFMNLTVIGNAGTMTEGDWLHQMTGADLDSIRQNIVGALAWLGVYEVTGNVQTANATAKPFAALGDAFIAGASAAPGVESGRLTANAVGPAEPSTVMYDSAPPAPAPPPPPPPAPPTPPPGASGGPGGPASPGPVSPLGMSTAALGKYSNAYPAYVHENYSQFSGVFREQVPWTMEVEGQAKDGWADGVFTRGPSGGTTITEGKAGGDPPDTPAQKPGYKAARAGTYVAFGQRSGHRGYNPKSIGTVFDGSRVDVWRINNVPGDVSRVMVWQSSLDGTAVRIIVPPDNLPPVIPK